MRNKNIQNIREAKIARRKLKIKYVNHGVANNFGKYIELHKDLKRFPNLKRFILRHELKHSGKFFSIYDLLMDLNIKPSKETIQLWRFMATRPSTLTQFLPIYYTKKQGFIVDINLIIAYLGITLVTFILYLVLF